MDIIELVDEFGEKKEFVLISTFGMDDENYAVLIPAKDQNTEEAILLRLRYLEDGNVEFSGIEDEKEFEDAYEIYQELMKEQEQ